MDTDPSHTNTPVKEDNSNDSSSDSSTLAKNGTTLFNEFKCKKVELKNEVQRIQEKIQDSLLKKRKNPFTIIKEDNR